MFKKIISVFFASLMILTVAACSGGSGSKDDAADKYVKAAIPVVKEAFEKKYAEIGSSDKTIEIINTRVITIKENDNEFFKDVEAVVEFDILSGISSSAPYYYNDGRFSKVAIMKNGTAKLDDPFGNCMRKYYQSDFSDVIDEIWELGTKYNTESIEITGADNAQKALVEKAQEALKEQWKKIYEKNSNVVKSDGTLRIIRTRIIEPAEIPEGYEGYFGDIETIVEFELYTDNAGSAPYYMNGHNYNEIIFHKDGTTEPASFYLKKVASAKADFSFVEGFKVTDLGDAFNGEYNVGGTK